MDDEQALKVLKTTLEEMQYLEDPANAEREQAFAHIVTRLEGGSELVDVKVTRKPTIEELEKLLDGPERPVEIMPDGSIRAKDYEEPSSIAQLVNINNKLAKHKRELPPTKDTEKEWVCPNCGSNAIVPDHDVNCVTKYCDDCGYEIQPNDTQEGGRDD